MKAPTPADTLKKNLRGFLNAISEEIDDMKIYTREESPTSDMEHVLRILDGIVRDCRTETTYIRAWQRKHLPM